MPLFTPLEDACLTEPQQKLKLTVAKPGAPWPGPFNALSRVPDIGLSVHAALQHFATASRLTQAAREVAILTVAQAMPCEYGWHAHVPLALSLGISSEALTLLGSGGNCLFEDSEIDEAESFTRSLMANRLRPSPRKPADEVWLVELMALVGIYRMLFQLVNIDCPSPMFSAIPLQTTY